MIRIGGHQRNPKIKQITVQTKTLQPYWPFLARLLTLGRQIIILAVVVILPHLTLVPSIWLPRLQSLPPMAAHVLQALPQLFQRG